MKVVVKVVGHGAQVEVSAGALPRYLEQREMARMLDWAEERGLKYVEWMYPSGRVTVTRCLTCREPTSGTVCNYCFPQRNLVSEPDAGQLSAEELEHRAQLAERMSVEYARLAIELQARAATAEHDPIEIEVLPESKFDKFDEVLAQMLARTQLHTATGKALDDLAQVVGVYRSNNGLFTESDSSLRKRIRAYVDAKNQRLITIDLAPALGFKPGDMLTVNGATVKITKIEYDVSGRANISYTGVLPGALDTVSVGYTIE